MSDSNRVNVIYKQEATFAVPPGTSPNYDQLRLTSLGLHQETRYDFSKEIRSDRQIADRVRLAFEGQGDLGIEWSVGAHDNLILGGLHAASFSSPATASGLSSITITYTAANLPTEFALITAGSGTPFASGFAVGDLIRITGSGVAANNGKVFKVTSQTSTVLKVKGNALTAGSDVSSGTLVITRLGAAINGITAKTFTVQAEYADLATEFARWLGCGVNTLGLNAEVEQILTGTVGFLGKKEESSASNLDAAATAAAANDVMNAVDHVSAVIEGMSSSNTPATGAMGSQHDSTSFSLAINNSAGARNIMGASGAQSLRWGSFDLSGTLRAYYTSKAFVDKYLAATATSLIVQLTDAGGLGYVFEIPRVKWTAAARSVPGLNGDVMEDLSWAAMRDPVAGYTLKVAKF